MLLVTDEDGADMLEVMIAEDEVGNLVALTAGVDTEGLMQSAELWFLFVLLLEESG